MFKEVLKYKGYQGSIELSLEDNCLHGKVLFIKDCIIYDGENLTELKQSFENAVDEYLAFCEEIGKTPETSCSGVFNVRISPDLHLKLHQKANEQGLSLNGFIAMTLNQALSHHHPR